MTKPRKKEVMDKRLADLSQIFHTHPDEGGDFLAMDELHELAVLQGREIEQLREELASTCEVLGEDYAGEMDLPDEKRRPVDSLASESLAQKDNEIERLREELAVKQAQVNLIRSVLMMEPDELEGAEGRG
ncbi:MAG: hypothetical protein ACYTG0_32165 [Planctomycetota bacterium]|jgi:hypothetical protein